MQHQPDTHKVQASTVVYQTGRIVSCMSTNGRDQLLLTADSEQHAEYQASVLRGLLADAYLAGQADERAYHDREAEQYTATCASCDRPIMLVDDEHGIWSDDRGIDCEFGSFHEPSES